jgi:hypothetical protein
LQFIATLFLVSLSVFATIFQSLNGVNTMTTNFTSNTYPAYLALTVLQKIIDGQALPEAPLSVEIRKPLETPDDEINSFLSDIRAAYNVLNNLEEAARCFAVYQCAPACLRNLCTKGG